MQREQTVGSALVVFGVTLSFMLAVALGDVFVGIVIGLPLIIAGAVFFVRAQRDAT